MRNNSKRLGSFGNSLYICKRYLININLFVGMRIRNLLIVASMLYGFGSNVTTAAIPDSLLSLRKAYRYNLVSPDTSLLILQTLRECNMAAEWEISAAEGDIYTNIRKYRRAVKCHEKALNDPAIADSTRQKMRLYRRLMDENDMLLEDEQVAYYIDKLSELADQCNDEAHLAMAQFTWGKYLHYHGDRQRGYEQCLKAIDCMKATNYHSKQLELRDFYIDLMRMYISDKRYNEALRVTQLHEEAAKTVTLPLADQRALRNVYGLRASLLAHMGRMNEADECYEQWKMTEGGNEVDDRYILDYLMLSRHDREAIDVLHHLREFLRAECDTVNYWMLDFLNKDAILHTRLGDFEMAARNSDEVSAISDSLRLRMSRKTMGSALYLIGEAKAIHKRNLLINWLVAALILLAIIMAIVIYYSHIIRKRNEKLRRVLNGLEAYRKMMMEQTEENVLPKKSAEESALDESRRLFVEMDAKITRERPFTDPNFGHEELIKFTGVEKERFERMITLYTNVKNSMSYINSRRSEYGAQLIVDNPYDTLTSIATRCGFNTKAEFISAFKFAFGISPRDYRDSIANLFKDKID